MTPDAPYDTDSMPVGKPVTFAAYLDARERAELDARAARAEQELDEARDELRELRADVARLAAERDHYRAAAGARAAELVTAAAELRRLAGHLSYAADAEPARNAADARNGADPMSDQGGAENGAQNALQASEYGRVFNGRGD